MLLFFRFTQQELLAIDLEGRCVITDHGAFILFNLYGPAITSEENAAERFAYKMRLYQVSCTALNFCHMLLLSFSIAVSVMVIALTTVWTTRIIFMAKVTGRLMILWCHQHAACHCAVPCCSVLCCGALRCAVLRCAALCRAMLC